MTDEQMRVKIAEACGFRRLEKLFRVQHMWAPGHIGWANAAWLGPDGGYAIDLPNYPNDLNACHEMEKVLTAEQRKGDAYAARIADTTGCDDMLFALIHATARQRCEAFLRTIGQYEEDK